MKHIFKFKEKESIKFRIVWEFQVRKFFIFGPRFTRLMMIMWMCAVFLSPWHFLAWNENVCLAACHAIFISVLLIHFICHENWADIHTSCHPKPFHRFCFLLLLSFSLFLAHSALCAIYVRARICVLVSNALHI